MFRYIKLYLILWVQGIQAQMEYKFDFILGNITTVLGQMTGIAFVWVIFQRIGDLNGWTLPQIMLIYGIAALPYGLFELFFNGLWSLAYYVRKGDFDQLMVRPVDSLLLIWGDQPRLHGLGNLLTGIVIIVIASNRLGLRWNIASLAFLVLMTICGTMIYVSINTITASTSFWFVGLRTTVLYLGQRVRDFAVYPLDIYAPAIRILLTWVLPFAFTGFYPATYFLGRVEYRPFVYLVPVVAVAFLGIAYGIWRVALNQYQSTGS